MGAGKTSVGLALGRLLDWQFEDLDDRIEQSQGRTVAEIFRTAGESEFRRAERAALSAALLEVSRRGRPRIVALGGGAFVQPGNAKRLKAAGVPTVFLDAPVEELWRRCREQASRAVNERPLLGSLEGFCQFHEARRQGYLKASLRIDTGSRSVEAISQEIVKTLGLKEERPGARNKKQEGEAG